MDSVFVSIKDYLITAESEDGFVNEVWESCDSCGVVVDSKTVGWNCPNCGGEVSSDE